MSAMADWLAGEAPEGFTLDQDFALQSISEDRARATFKGHDLESAHVTEHLEAGRLPIKLAMTYDDCLSFVLTERGELKRLDFLAVIRDQAKADEHEDAEALFNAEFALMAGELLRLIPALVDAMGGELVREPDLADRAKEAA
jgi:recombination associated protein RdgC